jgi:LacI family transcriptional regulator
MLLKPFSMGKRVSLVDIARATGFAISTVSMALRNDASIPAATRKRIDTASRELGYYPNPLLAALASKQFSSKQMGGTPIALIRRPEKSQDDEILIQKIIEAQKDHARKFGYRLEAFRTDGFTDGKQATRVLFSRGFQGILLDTHFRLDLLPGMDWSRFSVVGWGGSTAKSYDSSPPLISRAVVDHFGVVLRAWQETWKRGYRRIGFVLFDLQESVREDLIRWGAVLTCLQRLPPRHRIPPLMFEFRPEGFTSHPLGEWARRYRPDAVIGFNGLISWALEKEGLRIPEDLAFASLHKEIDTELPLKSGHREAGMKEMRLKSMFAALELLDQQIRHHQYGLPREPRTIMIDSEWLEGETLPPKTKV